MAKEEHIDKERIKESLQKIGQTAGDFLERIERLREDVELVLKIPMIKSWEAGKEIATQKLGQKQF